MSESKDKPEEEPKLVVDTDWKEQVAREKEMASQADDSDPDAVVPDAVVPDDEEDSGAAGDVTEADAAQASQPEAEYPAAPPASFEVLISMMFTQAMAMLGQMPDPANGETMVNKPYAKHYIDTLDMLGEKTKGNLTDSEAKMLSEALHALRMAYVSVKG